MPVKIIITVKSATRGGTKGAEAPLSQVKVKKKKRIFNF